MSILSGHVYSIVSRGQVNDTNVALDLLGGSSEKGTQCQIWGQSTTKDVFNQLWLIKEIQGWSSAAGSPYEKNQQWKFVPNEPYFKIQNVASQTFVDVFQKNYAAGTKVHGWQSYATESQDWVIRRVSRTGDEIKAVLSKNPHITKTCKTYLQDGLYITLPKGVREEIYSKSGLKTLKWRNQIFDCDDFAFITKGEVAKWGAQELLADGFAILWGVMFGEKGTSTHAYNFYLNESLDAVVFFEPQNGQEMADIGYQGYFSVF
ncbi:hypothetical protein JR316_0004156 [Psilocybe cubensis]|uniref:Uncharacterized protein n=1 Tax=Psilocybe cubensis TaxID=181762 RepID=A0ACB8H2F2_PSICU|nr:hypothetical protein JR316_0004156 [Psilocybe cubensis]KAH9482061.1 hypothetical protein JR316_0004156 [Psilocybe cubensis]